MAARLGVPDVSTDYRELLARHDIDAVTIATPDVMHYPVALAALQAGKHVFCEKPLTMTVEEARTLVAEAALRDAITMAAFTFRYDHSLRRLKELIQEGTIGEPTYCSIAVHWPSVFNPSGSAAWRNYAADSTAGMLGDMGAHYFDVIQYVLSPVTALAAITAVLPRAVHDRKTGEPRTTDSIDLATCLVRTAYPAPTQPPYVQGHLVASWMTPPRGHNGNLHLSGTTGALSATLGRGQHERLELYRGRQWEPVELPADADTDQTLALPRMMGAFVDAILRGDVDPERDATFADGLRAQLALDAVLRSTRSGCWETVPAT